MSLKAGTLSDATFGIAVTLSVLGVASVLGVWLPDDFHPRDGDELLRASPISGRNSCPM